MNISKEKIQNGKCISKLERKMNRERKWTSNIVKFICKNKIITTSIIVFFMCVIMNLILIYNFLRILQQI